MDKLFWIDMEMSGLDVEKEVIIEVAALVTDFDFQIIDSYEAVVKQPQHYIDNMDDWNRKHHGESGLIERIPNGKAPELVEDNLCELVLKYFPCIDKDTRPVIAGNSIANDRVFIDRYFKKLSPLLHYRMLDVTSWKVIFNKKFKLYYEKHNAHRALDDILESIDELKFYCTHLKVEPEF
jgi:oligoribonuclease